MYHPVSVVGVGDDGAEGLAPAVRALVEGADVLCGGQRQLAFFPTHPARRLVIRGDLEVLLEEVRIAAESGRVVVLASGDPLFFGIGARLVETLGRERVRIIPHPSAVQVAFARLGVPWQDALVLSAHGRPLEPLLGRALGARRIAILTDDRNTPSVIAAALLAAGMEACQAFVLERLEGPGERVEALRLDQVVGREFDPLNVLVLLRERATRRLALGLPDDAYHHRGGMITKAEVRSVSLSKFSLRADSVVWDVGAGCGSLAIEAAALAPDGWVYAIERDPDQVALLRENRARHLAANVAIVEGEAPQALESLPDPDAVFIGGSGGHLTAVLALSLARLRSDGRLVLNAVLLETVVEAERLCREAGWSVDVTLVAISRGVSTAGGTRLAALNPVFVLAAQRDKPA